MALISNNFWGKCFIRRKDSDTSRILGKPNAKMQLKAVSPFICHMFPILQRLFTKIWWNDRLQPCICVWVRFNPLNLI